jgi:hypothetical protein
MAKDYNQVMEDILGAIQIVAEKEVQKVSFDKTIVCEITDDSNKEKGEYVVDDGSIAFRAYSENTSYNSGTHVYVTIPGGDYNNQKIIIGKYTQDNTEYYTYTPPMDSYVDITKNLITDSLKEQWLIANDSKEKVIWSKKDISNAKGYDRLGLRADFKTRLSSFNLLSGSYGLRLDIISEEPQTSQTESEYIRYSYYLDSSDMYGDPYNFETYYSQELVFDISNITQITQMSLVLYQKNNFVNSSGLISSYPEGIEDNMKELFANIFATNVYISLGYDLNDFDEDRVLLYTLDSETYAPFLTGEGKDTGIKALEENNYKHLQVRWIHQDSDTSSFYTITDMPKEGKLHWYRYVLKEDISDELAGAFWQEITDTNSENIFEIEKFSPDISLQYEKIKVIIEYPSREYIEGTIEDDEELASLLGVNSKILKATQDKLIELKGSEKEEDIELYNNINSILSEYYGQVNYYYSDILELDNEREVANQATIDLIRGLSIVCDEDGYNGIYCIYSDTGEIMSSAENTKQRILSAKYSSLITGDDRLDTAEQITWKIPLQNTMIELVEGKDYNSNEAYIDSGYLNIIRTGISISEDRSAGDEIATDAEQYFHIKKYYSQTAINNTVYCQVIKNNITYEASYTLSFGPSGSNGTNYTFTLEFEDKVNALNFSSKDKVKVIPHVYNYEKKDITDEFESNRFSYDWYSEGKGGIEKEQNGNGCSLWVNNTTNFSNCQFYILRGMISEVDTGIADTTTNLTAFLCIPVKLDDTYTAFDGATKIVYNTAGTSPQYYQDPYKLYTFENNRTKEISDITWKMAYGDDTQGTEDGVAITSMNYYPQVSKGGTLTVPSMFLQDNGVQIAVNGYLGDNLVWTQPIRIYQDSYASSAINSWDGSLTLDEKNGTILSTMVGAGYKDNQNRFHGVLMGDVATGSGDSAVKKIGLYGYHEGVQSFGLKVDGTAFFGKSDKGQILIDGNTGVIKSSTWGTSGSDGGMKIDLDDGIIDTRSEKYTTTQGTTTQARILIDPCKRPPNEDGTEDENKVYFLVQSKAGNPLFKVGSDSYFLQSDDYESGSSGVNFNLATGKLTAYNFSIQATNSTEGDSHKGSYISLNSNGNPYFKIHYEDSSTEASVDLINITKTAFALRSQNWADGTSGTLFDLAKGRLYMRSSWTKDWEKDSSGNNVNNSYVRLSSLSGEPYFTIRHKGKILFEVGTYENSSGKEVSSYLLQSADYDASAGTGLRFDLATGKLTAYDFMIKAFNSSNTNKSILINSGASEFPLRIQDTSDGGNDFKVSWSGAVTCDNLTATGGKIANFNISKNALYTGSSKIGGSGVYLGSDGLSVADGAFKVDSDGNLTIGSKFKVTSSGAVTCGDLTATGGEIGGFKISKDGLSYGDTGSLVFGDGKISFGEEGTVILGNAAISYNNTDRWLTIKSSTSITGSCYVSSGTLSAATVEGKNYTVYIGNGGYASGYTGGVTVQTDSGSAYLNFQSGILIGVKATSSGSSVSSDE